jgi:small subunit ribosomal protein S11
MAEEETKKAEEIKVEEKVEAKMEEKKEESREERAGIAYIYCTPNNTMVHITDLSGNTLSRITGGMVTKHSRLKADPTIAMFVAKKAAERPKDLGINALYVRIRAKTGSESIGPGSHAAVKSLEKTGFKIISVLETTRVARGGPKKKGGKRGRRV